MKKAEIFTSNPLVPNSKNYWCYRCKAHSGFNHIVNRGGGEVHETMSCLRCKASMFQPSQTLAWTVGSLGFSLIAIVIGGGIGGDGLLLCLGLAACSGLIGLVMLYFMILWSVWGAIPESKTAGTASTRGQGVRFIIRSRAEVIR